jgi:hypothetical protein
MRTGDILVFNLIYPNTSLFFRPTESYQLFIDRIDNPTTTTKILFDCNQNMTYCSSTKTASVGRFEFSIFQQINEKWVQIFINIKPIEIVSLSFISPSVRLFYNNMTERLRINGANFYPSPHWGFRLLKGTNFIDTQDVNFIDDKTVDFKFPFHTLPLGASYILYISLNDFKTPLSYGASFYVIDKPIIEDIFNLEFSEKLNFFSFRRARISIIGQNIPTVSTYYQSTRIM